MQPREHLPFSSTDRRPGNRRRLPPGRHRRLHPGITSNYSSLQFAGHESEAFLLGIFQVSILHNIVHLLFGIAGIAMAKTGPASSKYLIIGGIIYAILWIYGLIVAPSQPPIWFR